MPYIEKKDREKFHTDVDLIKQVAEKIETCGELNYVFTLICQQYLLKKGIRYQNINDIVGALEGCKLEFYRRIASHYEDDKILSNGDVCLIEKYKFPDAYKMHED